MKMLKVLEKRHSVRAYEQSSLSALVLERVEWLIRDMPELDNSNSIQFSVLHDGEAVYDKLNGVIGYNGIMIKAPHYIMITCEPSDHAYQAIGYLGEWLALSLAQMDIGTCWLEAGSKSALVKEKLNLAEAGTVAALIAFGEPNEEKKLSRIYDTNTAESFSPLTAMGYPYIDASVKDETYSNRKSIVEIVDLKTFGNQIELEELSQRGLSEIFWYMRLAPSWGNQQPWKFILDGENIVLTIEKNKDISSEIQRIDAGIGMLYFEVATHDKGFSGKWYMDGSEFKERLNIPESHFIAGYFKM